jgi:hypothetical protein
VRDERRRVTFLAGGLTVALVVALGLRPVSYERIAAAYVLALAAVALGAATRLLGDRAADEPVSTFERMLSRRREPQTRPPELVRVEREIVLGMTSAGHLHNRLLPLLRDAAAARLGPRLGREELGDEAWELLRPDRPGPVDRNAPGLSLRRVRELVATLERL